MPNRRHEIFYLYEHLWQEICAINAQAATQTKLQLKWFFQCNLWSLSNSRGPGGPVTVGHEHHRRRLPLKPRVDSSNETKKELMSKNSLKKPWTQVLLSYHSHLFTVLNHRTFRTNKLCNLVHKPNHPHNRSWMKWTLIAFIWRLLAIENPGTWNITYVNAPMA